MNRLSPLAVNCLLHFHTRPTRLVNFDTPASIDVTEMFLRVGAIAVTEEHGVYNTTALGAAWVSAICNTPPPTLAFIDAAGNVIL
jgi:hypothetical protein